MNWNAGTEGELWQLEEKRGRRCIPKARQLSRSFLPGDWEAAVP